MRGIDLLSEVAADAVIDSVKLLPFLFLTYLLMEYLEHKTSERTNRILARSGKFGPLYGALLGIFPQCGFSAAASNLYAGRIISVGTLVAVYLSTSDEMLPILISERAPLGLIGKILAAKVLIGLFAGLIIDLCYRRCHGQPHEAMDIHHLCEQGHCGCGEKGIFRSALWHTLEIFCFILAIGFVLNLLISLVGEERLSSILLSQPILGELTAGLIGLIPNCAASVVITRLYLEGLLSTGLLLTGLLANSGVGILVLFRVNGRRKENWRIVGVLYGIGVVCGFIVNLLGITF